ncbi:hypothetical protein EC973_007776 [Apophysomyces ossiformis]|uniref:AP180 N-terminal homology (ANTH) domain-containing protein n=1 Tax=Apophysomyces ossiformis TaxID=679940 RepID=A0A8H7BZ04_9FUNG|nr:hypothetical protein EC973_007776 [Apophysomyces ossiformis]
MSKPDATTALNIYRRFAKQTEETVSFVESTKKLETSLGMSVPTLKHAPLSLAAALEEYLNDPEPDKQPPKPVENAPGIVSAPTRAVSDFFDSLQKQQTVPIFSEPLHMTFLPSIQSQPTHNFVPALSPPPHSKPQLQSQFPSQLSTQVQLQPQPQPQPDINPFRAAINPQTTGSQLGFGVGNISQPSNTLTRSMSVMTPQPTGSSNPFRSNTLPIAPFNPVSQGMWNGSSTQLFSQPTGTNSTNPFTAMTNSGSIVSPNPVPLHQYNNH